MKYAAPKLTRYGTVAALTASDLKCTPGTDQHGLDDSRNSGNVWFANHTNSTWDQYSEGVATGASVGGAGFAELLAGRCETAELGPHPTAG